MLKYEIGWDDMQIAEILHINHDAARQRLARAKKRLATIIQSNQGGIQNE